MVMPIAVVAYEGVLADESEAFRDVLSRLPGARMITVGERLGALAGPGGVQRVDATFADVDRVSVVVVPGGLDTGRHPEMAQWLRHVTPRWILASSTGSALLAVAGLLTGRTAASHWLARPLLEVHGVAASPQRVVVDDPFVTCAGLASTHDCAFVVARAIGGPMLELSIRESLKEAAAGPTPSAPPGACPARSRYRPRGSSQRPGREPPASSGHPPETELQDAPGARSGRRRRRT